MFGLFTKTLRRRLISLMVIASLVPVIAIAFFAIRNFSDGLYNLQLGDIRDELHIVSEAIIHQEIVPKTEQLLSMLEDGEQMQLMDSLYLASKVKSSNIPDIKADTALYEAPVDVKAISSQLDKMLAPGAKRYGFIDLYFTDEEGKVLWALNKKQNIGLLASQIDDKDFNNCVKESLLAKKPIVTDFGATKFSDNKATMFIAVPEYLANGENTHTLVGELSGDWLLQSIDDYSALARDDQVDIHIVGMDGKVRSSKDRSVNDAHGLGETIKSEIIDFIAKEKAWEGIAKDEQGIEVLAATVPFNTSVAPNIVFDLKWGISMEVPTDIVFAPVYEFARNTVIAAIIIVILFALIAFFVANGISKPISALAGYAKEAANGNLCIEMKLKPRKDEIEVLTNSFAMMFENLKVQINQTASASTQLSSSMKEIATTITQLSSSVTETSSAVNEITSTIEEVRQISNLANKRAEDMSNKADGVRSVADEGKTSSERVSHGIMEINRQVESIANTTIKLGDQTKNISEIIDSVTDIADQSNLLSVNASIEAAKAGEYGRGFSVVAREIKSLADKSKESTKQIKDILTEIQKSASGAIMATEKGTKTVAEGLELSKTSKTSIEKLEESVNTAVDTATQILASSKEQLNGMNQLFETVGSIKLAMQQNSEGIKQLEIEAKNMSDLAVNLSEMTKKFKVK